MHPRPSRPRNCGRLIDGTRPRPRTTMQHPYEGTDMRILAAAFGALLISTSQPALALGGDEQGELVQTEAPAAEAQQPEAQQAETQPPEAPKPDVQQSEAQPAEAPQPEAQQAKAQPSETQRPEAQQPDVQQAKT